MDRVEEIQSAAQSAAARVSDKILELSEQLGAHPAVKSALDHPIFQHEIFQHPAFQHPLLRDPMVLAAIAGLLVILLVFSCELMSHVQIKLTPRFPLEQKGDCRPPCWYPVGPLCWSS